MPMSDVFQVGHEPDGREVARAMSHVCTPSPGMPEGSVHRRGGGSSPIDSPLQQHDLRLRRGRAPPQSVKFSLATAKSVHREEQPPTPCSMILHPRDHDPPFAIQIRTTSGTGVAGVRRECPVAIQKLPRTVSERELPGPIPPPMCIPRLPPCPYPSAPPSQP